MMGGTHLVIGGAAWLATLALIAKFSHTTPNALEVVAGWPIAAVGALCPDIDSPKSLITKSLGPITKALSWVVIKLGSIGDPHKGFMRGHRRFTHSIIGIGLVLIPFLLGIFDWRLRPWVALAFMVGWVSHILADMLTKMGCPLLWPKDHCYGMHWIKTGSYTEVYAIRSPAIVANIALIIWLVWMVVR